MRYINLHLLTYSRYLLLQQNPEWFDVLVLACAGCLGILAIDTVYSGC